MYVKLNIWALPNGTYRMVQSTESEMIMWKNLSIKDKTQLSWRKPHVGPCKTQIRKIPSKNGSST